MTPPQLKQRVENQRELSQLKDLADYLAMRIIYHASQCRYFHAKDLIARYKSGEVILDFTFLNIGIITLSGLSKSVSDLFFCHSYIHQQAICDIRKAIDEVKELIANANRYTKPRLTMILNHLHRKHDEFQRENNLVHLQQIPVIPVYT